MSTRFEKIQRRAADELLLTQFLTKWPVESLNRMSLSEYNSIWDKNTFCQYVETQTRELGSNKGGTSAKFGIYRRLNLDKRPRGTISNEYYTWSPRFNSEDLDELKTFRNVINEVQKVANFAMAGDFEEIEKLKLNPLFRWKVAFLYSENRLIPIFAKTSLLKIVNKQGMTANYNTPYYDMQKYLMARKPYNSTTVEYMRDLFDDLRGTKKNRKVRPPARRRRHAVARKLGGQQLRSGHQPYTAHLFHNEIQMALKSQLIDLYGKENVYLEKDWVDVMVELPNEIILYEIKTDRYASDCFFSGLGQILDYAYHAKSYYHKDIKLVIAGPNDLFENELNFIDFLTEQIKMPISYLKIEYELYSDD